jgi:cytochrome P450 family 142 subfamily A polypeptide 1
MVVTLSNPAHGHYGPVLVDPRGDHPVMEGLNLLDGGWYADDPHAVWSWMRREAPVYHDPVADVWGIALHEDVLAIEKDPRRFSSRRAPRPHGHALPMMISMDDPDHQRRRSLVNRGFTPRRVAEMEPMVSRLFEAILDRVCERGTCDFVWDVAAPLPLMVIAELLGFAEDDLDDLLRWSDDMLRATTLDPSPEVAQAGLEAMLGFREFQLDVIARRRSSPGDDLVSVLCAAEVDGHRLDDESIVNETLLLLIGGDETTRHVISGGVLALLEHPDQMAALRDDPELLPVAVEELLRWVSPVKNMARTVVGDVVLRGQRLRDGDQVMLFYPSANRDEAVFDRADRFDVRRHPNPHLAFGFGPHYCLGASLARLELRVALRAVLDRLGDLEPAGDGALPHRRSNFVSGLESMPVRFTPTAPVT